MRYAGTVLVLGSLTAGSITTYEACTAPGAAWFNEGKFVSQPAQTTTQEAETGYIHKPTNHGHMQAPKYENEAYADFVATGPPKMDDYPKSPEEAASKGTSLHKSMQDIVNFGVYKEK